MVSIVIWGTDFDGGRKVEYDTIFSCISFPPSLLDSLANLNRKLWFCLREGFWTILESESGAVFSGAFFSKFLDEEGMPSCELDGLFF